MLRKVGDQPTLWKALLFAVALVMPAELERVDQLLDDDRLFDSIVANLNVIGLNPRRASRSMKAQSASTSLGSWGQVSMVVAQSARSLTISANSVRNRPTTRRDAVDQALAVRVYGVGSW